MRRILFFCNRIGDPNSYIEQSFYFKKDLPNVSLMNLLINWVKRIQGEDSINSMLVEYDYDELFN